MYTISFTSRNKFIPLYHDDKSEKNHIVDIISITIIECKIKNNEIIEINEVQSKNQRMCLILHVYKISRILCKLTLVAWIANVLEEVIT